MLKLAISVFVAVVFLGGCSPTVKVNVPEGYAPRRSHVDSSRVPETSTHSEARRELEKAYAALQERDREIAKLKRDKDDLKRDKKELERDKDELKRRIKRLEDRRDD